jgi:uncharacterized membrane protein
MESRARFLGHPIHQVLIVFPLGLLATAVIFDVLHFITGDATWTGIAFYMIPAGIVGGLIAALFGVIDWTGIPTGTRAKSVATLHGLGNVVVILLFGGSWLLRQHTPSDPGLLAYILSFAGLALSGVTGWLGGEPVDRMGVGVARGANLNAPSSLSGRSASENIAGD